MFTAKKIKHRKKSCSPHRTPRASGSHAPTKRSLSKNPSKRKYESATITKIIPPINHVSNSPVPTLSISIPRQPIIIRRTRSTAKLGLTPKEKSYLISTCQNRYNRYSKLKTLATDAMRTKKVYIVYGNNMAIRRALDARGWVEKIPPESMNFNRLANKIPGTKTDINSELERLLLSNIVERHIPNFIWKVRDTGRQSLELNHINKTIINKLKMDTVWTSKQGLCSSVKKNNWFYIDHIADINTPRTYNSYDKDDYNEFVSDFRLTSCTNLLKWVVLMDKTQQKVFVSDGKVSSNIIVFALNRCKEYLLHKQHKDLDRSWRTVSAGMWNVFLKNYYRLIANEESFQEDIDNKVPLYMAYAKVLLSEIQKYRPQMRCEGMSNMWIIKPGHCSRGRGIRLASKLGIITNIISKSSQKHVIQKYIEEPLLIYDTKFDIRQYYLVTSTFPLIIWMYTDCYLKFSSQKYNLKNYHESIHLTNNAVQRKYKNCQGRNAELPFNNMWSLERYKEYLKSEGKGNVWNEVIYPGMKRNITAVMLSSQDYMSTCKNRFELYGCDFILDNNYNPWLIEINSSPDLNPTTKVTAIICPAVVEDIIKVVIDRPRFSKACTGHFECIYKQPITFPNMHRLDNLIVEGCSLPSDYFCKTTILQEKLDSKVDLDKECDIQGTLKHLKTLYMEENEKELKKCVSDEELEELASVITSQLDIIMEKLPSTPTMRSSEKCTEEPSKTYSNQSFVSLVSHASNEELKSVQSYFSEMDLTTVLHKTITRTISTGLVDRKGNNYKKITQPDFKHDIEAEKGRGNAEKIFQGISNKTTREAHEHILMHRFGTSPSSPVRMEAKDEFPSAATKILSFITRKQREIEQMRYPLSDTSFLVKAKIRPI